MELPGHGAQRNYEDVSSLSPHKMINLLYNQIDVTCPRENLFITAYSVSGMLFMKMWGKLISRNHDLKGIFIGGDSSAGKRREVWNEVRIFTLQLVFTPAVIFESNTVLWG